MKHAARAGIAPAGVADGSKWLDAWRNLRGPPESRRSRSVIFGFEVAVVETGIQSKEQNRFRIAIADDSADVLVALRLLLKPAGFVVAQAHSPGELLALVR